MRINQKGIEVNTKKNSFRVGRRIGIKLRLHFNDLCLPGGTKQRQKDLLFGTNGGDKRGTARYITWFNIENQLFNFKMQENT